MAGAYCRFCDHRCFVYRVIDRGTTLPWSGHLATCEKGKAHDREQVGADADTAINPLDP
jgi:hypothetical protein